MRAFAVAFWLALIAPAALALPAVAPSEAPKHLGETVTVEGAVDEVHTDARSGVTFINLGGRFPNQALTCVIFRDDAPKFPNVDELPGHVVRITGKVQNYKGRVEIICNDAGQLKIK